MSEDIDTDTDTDTDTEGEHPENLPRLTSQATVADGDVLSLDVDMETSIAEAAELIGDCPHCPTIVPPIDVLPRPITGNRQSQGGIEILSGICPHCGSAHSVAGTGPAKIVCPCGTWIELN